MFMSSSSKFTNCLPKRRLGKKHESYDSFHTNSFNKKKSTTTSSPRTQKEYTLIVVVQSNNNNCSNNNSSSSSSKNRILLGMKNRGFGKGFYNSFGGKIDTNDKSIIDGAIRELKEETNIKISKDIMKKSSIGELHFTFDDDDALEMIIHLFMIDLTKDLVRDNNNKCDIDIDTIIKGCDEITPIWFNDWYDIPLHQMFADDSIWLTALLSSCEYDASITPSTNNNKLKFNGWFHYDSGGQDVNTILHYYLQLFPSSSSSKANHNLSLEKRMFHELHVHKINNPTIKEFKESWAFVNTVKSNFNKDSSFDVVIDVAGGHGALAALFLSLTSAKEGIVIDPAIISSGIEGIEKAWHVNFFPNKILRYRHERLQTALVDELENTIQNGTNRTRVLVVACHACQHLTQDTIDISERYGVHIAVMSCCQKDITGSWKSFCNNYNNNVSTTTTSNSPSLLNIGTVMDLLAAGKMMNPYAGMNAGVSYIVKMKMIDKSITPHHNRIIICKAVDRSSSINTLSSSNALDVLRREKIEMNLDRAYVRAHGNINNNSNNNNKTPSSKNFISMKYLMHVQCIVIGIGLGIMISSYVL